jgi:protein-disulfide isomerase
MSTTQWDAVLAMPVNQDRDHTQGPADAAVTLVQYGDYECPYSGAAYPIVKEVQAQMGERLRFVFRNYPITASHPHAQQAAEAAEAAATGGKFWEMHAVPDFADAVRRHEVISCHREVRGIRGTVVYA